MAISQAKLELCFEAALAVFAEHKFPEDSPPVIGSRGCLNLIRAEGINAENPRCPNFKLVMTMMLMGLEFRLLSAIYSRNGREVEASSLSESAFKFMGLAQDLQMELEELHRKPSIDLPSPMPVFSADDWKAFCVSQANKLGWTGDQLIQVEHMSLAYAAMTYGCVLRRARIQDCMALAWDELTGLYLNGFNYGVQAEKLRVANYER